MLGINNQTVNQVTQMSSKYSQDFNGLLKAVSENGGISKVDEAMRYVNNPMVKKGLNMVGLDTNQIDQAYQQLKHSPLSVQNTSVGQQSRQVGTNEYVDRLNRIRRK